MIDMHMKKCSPIEIFKFEKRDIVFELMYERKMDSKFKQAFRYLLDRIKPQKFEGDLGELEWEEGKSYNWIAIEDGNVTLMLRKYHSHFTVYFRIMDSQEFNGTTFDESNYGCFIFHSDREKMTGEESDQRVDDNYLDLNTCFAELIKHLREKGSHMLWNPYSLVRPKFVDVKNIWDGGREHITSIDLFIYCCEELFEKYLEHYAMNETLEKIKTFKVGDMLDAYKITSMITDVKDGYYHGVGLELQNTNFPDSKPSWADVYSLTRYYYEYVFGKEEIEKDAK